ncbi:hypothetical protein CGCF413_v010399 [Colletotrichum fructicola]|nr:hypothetical protein CGCF413_v010399 [Colletotrichum fructicola]
MDTSFSEATATPPPTPPPSTSRTLSINDLLNPPPTTTPTKNKRARAHELTRDQKIEICAFRKYLKWTYEDIAKNTPFTLRQVQSACQDDAPVTPKKNKGRKGLIRTPEKDQLKACINSASNAAYACARSNVPRLINANAWLLHGRCYAYACGHKIGRM